MKYFRFRVKKLISLTLVLMLVAMAGVPVFSAPVKDDNVVLIGYYSEPGMMNGAEEGAIKSGYAYEAMMEVAAHAGWEYSYVYGTFAELMDKLEKGEIDMLPYVNISAERQQKLLFPDYGMVDDSIYLASLTKVTPSPDFHEINGKRIGSTRGYYQNTVLEAFLREHGLDCKIVLYPDSEEKWAAAERGDVDFTVESSLIEQGLEIKPVCKLGEDVPAYTAISKSRPDLLEQFNTAQQEIDAENPTFLSGLRLKYFKSIPLFKEMSAKDQQWLDEHESIRIGVFNNDAPLIFKADDGTVTGVMPDYLKRMFKNYGIKVKLDWVFYNSNEEALEGLRAGDIDVIHPYYPSYTLAESEGVIISTTVYRSPMGLLYSDNFTADTMKRVATPVTRLGAHYVTENYPHSEIVPCTNGYDCIDKMLAGEADCVILNSTALKKIAGEYNENFNIKTLHTLCNTCFAALPENSAVIDIINRAAPFLTDTELNEIEAGYYVESDTKVTLKQFFAKNPLYLALLVAFIMAVAATYIILFIKRRTELAQRAELEEARNAAEAANRAKTSFLFSMSHDIRTPMNAILGYTDIGLRHYDDAEKSKNSFERIKSSGDHLLNLINEILEMSRIESGRLEIAEHPMDLRDTIENIGQMSLSLAIPKSISFTNTVGELKNPIVMADELHINEVLINLISNAVKYTEDGGRVELITEQLDDTADGRANYRFTVKDNGIGMSEDFLQHLFENFARENTATVSRQEGAGLGLSIVKRIVDALDGTVGVKSRKGEGSVFTVELPLKTVENAEAASLNIHHPEFAQMDTDSELEGRRVLLVEDNEMNRDIAEEILEDMGFEIETAEDGAIALRMVEEKGAEYYDFILMDIQMPVMNGYEATMEIRKLPDGWNVPIIALSANAFKEDVDKSFEAGMNAHVAKPIDVGHLMMTMKGLCKK